MGRMKWGLSAAAAVLLWGSAANATYPEQPIRVVVPYPAGGPADLITRHLVQGLSTTMGASFVVDNRGGGGGNIGAQVVAKAPADG